MQARLSLTRKISKAGFHPFILMIIMPLVNKLLSRILANIMDQLGDLGRHAVDIMDGIGLEICTYICTYWFIPEYTFVKCSRATLLLANKPSRLS